MEAEDVLGGTGLGEAEPNGTGVGEATQWLSPPSSTGSSKRLACITKIIILYEIIIVYNGKSVIKIYIIVLALLYILYMHLLNSVRLTHQWQRNNFLELV